MSRLFRLVRRPTEDTADGVPSGDPRPRSVVTRDELVALFAEDLDHMKARRAA